MTIDILPTIAVITETPLPTDKKIDGMNVSGLWQGTMEKSPRNEPFFVYLPHTMPHIPLYVPDDVRDPDAAAKAMQQHMQAVLDRLARETT